MKHSILILPFLIYTLSLPAQETAVSSQAGQQGREASPSSQVLRLDQLTDSALQNNIAIRKGRMDIAQSQERRKEAFTSYFPSISATGTWFNANRSMARMDIDPMDYLSPEAGAMLTQSLPAEALATLASPMTMTMMKNGTIAGITAVQPVFAGGQIVLGNKLARVGEEASRLQLALSENEVEKQTAQYYWQLVSMEEKGRTLDAVEAMLADLHKNVKTAVDAGVALRNDLLQVELRQNEVQSQRLKLNNGHALVMMLLTQFCGLQKPFAIEVPDASSIEGRAVQTPPVHDASDVAHLAEYQLLQKNVEATTLQRRMEVAGHLPNVAVGAGYNYHNLLENDRSFAMVFATVSVPISDWWGSAHAIRRKRLAQRQAEEQLADNGEKLRIRMQKTWNDVVEAQSQLALAARSIEQAQENLTVHRNTYGAGTATMADLLQAQLLYQQACDQRTEAFINLQNALLAYKQATGRR